MFQYTYLSVTLLSQTLSTRDVIITSSLCCIKRSVFSLPQISLSLTNESLDNSLIFPKLSYIHSYILYTGIYAIYTIHFVHNFSFT